MTLQTLEYFIAVAQYRNFTKAAQACHVTQPALSRAIRALEEELGCTLLVRAGRTATLTAEGEVCLTEAKRVLQQCEELRVRVGEVGQRNRQPLRVGYVIIGYLNVFMQELLVKMSTEPAFRVETIYDTVSKIKDLLMSGEIDVALLPEPCMLGLEEIEHKYLLRGKLHVITHKSNPFYERKEVHLAELRDQPFVMWKESTLPQIRAKVQHLCGEAGFVPRIVEEGEKLGDILAQIPIYNGVGVGSALFNRMNISDYRGIPIIDTKEQFGVVCVWKKANPSPRLEEWKEMMK